MYSKYLDPQNEAPDFSPEELGNACNNPGKRGCGRCEACEDYWDRIIDEYEYRLNDRYEYD